MNDIKKRVVNYEIWQSFQDTVANKLGISIHIFDETGEAITNPSCGSEFCTLIRSNPVLQPICDNYARCSSTDEASADKFCVIDMCPFGIESFIFKIKNKKGKLYSLFAGQFYTTDFTLQKKTLLEILSRCGIKSETKCYKEIIQCSTMIPVYTKNELDQKYDFLLDVAVDYIPTVFANAIPDEIHATIDTKVKYMSLPNIIQTIVELLEKDISTLYTTDDILEKFSISRSSLYRGFVQYMSKSFSECYTDIKINEAKRLLTETNMPIACIAEQLGYKDASYLTKKFKKVTGVSPNSFRHALDFIYI